MALIPAKPKPLEGKDCGDHPPITVTGKYNDKPSGLYKIIAENFIKSLMGDL